VKVKDLSCKRKARDSLADEFDEEEEEVVSSTVKPTGKRARKEGLTLQLLYP